MIYIEALASSWPPIFQKSNESFGKERNLKWKIFGALRSAATMGEGFEQTLWGFRRHFSPPAPIVIIINDFEHEKQGEKKTTKTKTKVEQLIEFLAKPIEGGFLDVEPDSLNILVIVPTKAWWGARERSRWKRVVHLPKWPKSKHLLK